MNKRIAFALAAIVALALTRAQGADTVQVSTDTEASPEAPPEIDAMQADPAGPIKPVVVVNTPAIPVPVDGQVRVVNTPDVHVVNPVQTFQAARTPINRQAPLSIFDGDTGDFSDLFTVPAGKQLVITHASMAIAENSNVAFRIDLSNGGGFFAIHDIPGIRTGPLISGELNGWAASVPMEIYVPAGAKVDCSALRDDSTGNASGRCTIAGYLVDAPE